MLEGLHDPDAAWAGVPAETAGNAFLRIGDILVAYLGGHLPAGNGTGRAHGLTKMAIPALAAGKAAVCFAFHVGTAFNLRQVMCCGQCFKIDQFLIKRNPFFPLGLRDNEIC